MDATELERALLGPSLRAQAPLRLEDRHGGLLSLDAAAHLGALSETRAGDLSVADDPSVA